MKSRQLCHLRSTAEIQDKYNVMDARKRKDNKTANEQKRALAGKVQTNRQNLNPRSNRPNAKGTEITPGVVTLTQGQLDAILNTVGSLVTENNELKKSQPTSGFDDLSAEANALDLNKKDDSVENILNLRNRPQEDFSNSSGPRVVEPLNVPGLGGITSEAVRIVEPTGIPGLDNIDQPPTNPKAPLTKAEKKRLQWEKEKDSQGDEKDQAIKKSESSDSIKFGTAIYHDPRVKTVKGEMKRLQWEKELAENEVLGAMKGQADEQDNILIVPNSEFNDLQHNSGRSTIGELKRLQWEKERAENNMRDAEQAHFAKQVNSAGSMKLHQNSSALNESADNDGGGMDQGQGRKSSKAEQKRLQWEKERADNDVRQAEQNQPKLRQVRSHETIDLDGGGMDQGQGLKSSKAEQKRLQWEKERAENAAMDAIANKPAYNVRQQVDNNYNATRPEPPTLMTASIPRAHMSKAAIKRAQWEKEKAEEQGGGQPWLGSETQNVKPQQPVQEQPVNAFVPKAGMSKSEMKRQQWEKERQELEAEENHVFNPWGRPGAGAPIRDANGVVLGDFNQRKEVIRQERLKLAMETSNNSSSQPAAIRSSFVMGGVAPDGNRFVSVKEREKRAWLQDLERQMEENRIRKEKEKEKQLKEDTHDTWADSFKPPAESSLSNAHKGHTEEIRISSAPQVLPTFQPGLENADPQTPLNQTGNFSHLRGQNRFVDEQTQREMEERWRRQQEHQDAVKAQVEEHKRKNAEVKRRRDEEELNEERRLQAERDSLNAVYDLERQKAKDKEELQRIRALSLKQAMDASTEQAQRERHERRLRKLQQGGHDISHLNANFEAKMTPRAPPSVQHVVPMNVPGLELTPRDVAVTTTFKHEAYEQDKVMVPSKFKSFPSLPYSDPTSPRREFGVQTEDLTEQLQHLNLENISRQSSADIEFKGPFKNNSKKVRIKSSEKKVLVRDKEPKKVNQRPRWGGGGGTKKKVVKQSEKDPYFEKRKQQREAATVQRQKDMLELAEKSIAQAKHKSSIRSRSKPRNEVKGKVHDDVRSNAASRNGSTASVPVLRTRSNRQPSPPLPTHKLKRLPSPEPAPPIRSHRSRMDTHRSQAQRHTPHDTQENQPPLTNGYHGPLSPPIPTLRKQQNSRIDPPIHSYRSNSPPLPAVKHRLETEYNLEAHAFEPKKPGNLSHGTHREKYQDTDLLAFPTGDGDFVPFIRTANFLDPEMAEEPLPMSREATAIERARKAYVHSIQPASYGMKMTNYEDRALSETIPEMPKAPDSEWKKNPIMNPSLVTDHPTGRQDRILQQLSDLRRGLMQKQRELEVGSPMMD